jgi:hypothetical protein
MRKLGASADNLHD